MLTGRTATLTGRTATLTGRAATLTGRIATALILAAVIVALGSAGPAAGPARGAAGSAGQQARASDLAELAAIDVPAAWRVTRGRGVTVGVLDTGVNGSVPDLRGSVTTGPDFARGADPPGYRPPHWHGTFIASLIAGHGSGAGRASGVIGVAPAARILSVRIILDDDEPGFPIYNTNAHYEDAIASGIRYAVRHGVAVINMSLGTASAARPVRAAVAYAISRGVVVVASAGNNGAAPGTWSRYSYPASFTGVISVGAVDADHQRAPFSDRNASVVICAPGVAVVGAASRGGYLAVNGTSPASAFVAGVAALIKSRYPRLSPALVRQALVSSARHRPAGGYSRGAGFGEVDADGALAAAARLAAQRPAPGLAPAAHFGPVLAAGPIRVVHRDTARIAGAERLALAAAAGFLIALAALTVVILRSVRRPARPGSGLAGPAGPYDPAVTTAASGSRSRRR